jgi:hypothetical protein
MDDTRFKYRHILLSNTSTTEKFTSPLGGGSSGPKIPVRDRLSHRNLLLDQLDMASRDFEQLKNQRKATGIDEDVGITLTFQSEPDFELKFESLEFRPSGIELLSVQKRDGAIYASVCGMDDRHESQMGTINYQARSAEPDSILRFWGA